MFFSRRERHRAFRLGVTNSLGVILSRAFDFEAQSAWKTVPTHSDSRFFGKPLSDDQMIAELQAMVGACALKTVPNASLLLAEELGYSPESVERKPPSAQEAALSAENDSLRLLLEPADIDAKALLAQSGVDAEERDAADKLQKLIVGELHHRIKNNLATVSAIASQSFRTTTSIEHGQKAMEGRLLPMIC